VECVCTILEEGEAYTFNQARKKCRVSYETVKEYVTMERHDVNLRIVEECGRSVKPEDISKTYPGLRVYPLGERSSPSDPSPTELGRETERKQYIPRDLLQKRLSFLHSTEVSHLSSGKHVFRITPFFAI
jgi:hypothetical protein